MIQILNTMWDNKAMIDEPYETTGIYQTFKTVFSQEIFTDESVSTGHVCTRSLPVIVRLFPDDPPVVDDLEKLAPQK